MAEGIRRLMRSETSERKELGSDEGVRSLLEVGGALLRSETHAVLERLIGLDDVVKDWLTPLVDTFPRDQEGPTYVSAPEPMTRKTAPTLAKGGNAQREGTHEGWMPEEIEWWLKLHAGGSMPRGWRPDTPLSADATLHFLTARTDEMRKLVAAFEEKHGQRVSALVPLRVSICRECGAILGADARVSEHCELCGEDTSCASAVAQQEMTRLRPCVRRFYKQNVWLEEGVAHHFRSAGYEAVTGQIVTGSDGTRREIDVLAENPRNGLLVASECKTRQKGNTVKHDDITKLADVLRCVGIPTGVLVTTVQRERIHRDAFKIAARNAVQIWADAVDKSDAEWRCLISSLSHAPA